jgi:hypothetical protein
MYKRKIKRRNKMKVRNIVLAISLSVMSLAWAEVTEQQSNVNQQQLSKRPYAKAPVQKDATYEGDAAYEETNVKAEKNYKALQLHMLGKRPYAEKSAD